MKNLGTNISKTGEFDDAYFFHSVCECTSKDHSQELFLEIDKEGGYVSCTIYQDLFWMEQNQSNAWYSRIFFRLKNAIKYIFTGHVQVSGDHLFTKPDHIRDYANALLGAVDELQKRRQESMPPVQQGTGNDKR